MKYAALIAFMLIASCCTSQISLQPSPDGLYCTDTAGVREIARVLKELEYSRSELGIYHQILLASEREANTYQKLATQSDSVNELLVDKNKALATDNHSLKRERWYFGGGGVLVGVILVLLL